MKDIELKLKRTENELKRYKQAYDSNTMACGGEGQIPCMGDGDYSYQSFTGNA